MRVFWTDRAKDRLKNIEDYIAQENPAVAREQAEKILRRSMQLAELPEIGREVEGYNHENLREVLLRPWRIIYLRKPSQIDVITVLHYRQLLPADLLSFKRG